MSYTDITNPNYKENIFHFLLQLSTKRYSPNWKEYLAIKACRRKSISTEPFLKSDSQW